MGIIKLICDRKEERVRQGRKVTAVDGRYFKLAENLLYGELEVALDKDRGNPQAYSGAVWVIP